CHNAHISVSTGIINSLRNPPGVTVRLIHAGLHQDYDCIGLSSLQSFSDALCQCLNGLIHRMCSIQDGNILNIDNLKSSTSSVFNSEPVNSRCVANNRESWTCRDWLAS